MAITYLVLRWQIGDVRISRARYFINRPESDYWINEAAGPDREARNDSVRPILDAGWMAMSRYRGSAKQPLDQGYGLVCDLDGRPIPDLIVADTHQEHGVIAHRSGGKVPALPVGTRLRILPNHACATGAQHEGYNVVDGKEKVLAHWERFSGW